MYSRISIRQCFATFYAVFVFVVVISAILHAARLEGVSQLMDHISQASVWITEQFLFHNSITIRGHNLNTLSPTAFWGCSIYMPTVTIDKNNLKRKKRNCCLISFASLYPICQSRLSLQVVYIRPTQMYRPYVPTAVGIKFSFSQFMCCTGRARYSSIEINSSGLEANPFRT